MLSPGNFCAFYPPISPLSDEGGAIKKPGNNRNIKVLKTGSVRLLALEENKPSSPHPKSAARGIAAVSFAISSAAVFVTSIIEIGDIISGKDDFLGSKCWASKLLLGSFALQAVASGIVLCFMRRSRA